MNSILKENLITALSIAIKTLEDQEKARYGPTFKSALRAGFQDNLETLTKGKHLTIV